MFTDCNDFSIGETYTLMRGDKVLLFFKCIRIDDDDNSIKVRFLFFDENLIQYERIGGGYKFGFRDDLEYRNDNIEVKYKNYEWIYLNYLGHDYIVED